MRIRRTTSKSFSHRAQRRTVSQCRPSRVYKPQQRTRWPNNRRTSELGAAGVRPGAAANTELQHGRFACWGLNKPVSRPAPRGGRSHKYHNPQIIIMHAPSIRRGQFIPCSTSLSAGRAPIDAHFRFARCIRAARSSIVRALNIIPCGSDHGALGWRRAAQASMHSVRPRGGYSSKPPSSFQSRAV